jgi:hypothetical protein
VRIKTFTLNSKQEVISKIVREILNLFKVEVIGSHGEADYLQLSVVNHQLTPSVDGTGKGVTVESRLMLFDLQGNLQEYSFRGEGKGDEHQLIVILQLVDSERAGDEGILMPKRFIRTQHVDTSRAFGRIQMQRSREMCVHP